MRLNISDFSTASRKEFSDSYGTWFSAVVNPKKLMARCDEQIANCKNWIENLEQLKSDAHRMLLEERKDELKAYLELLTKEEREQFLNN